MYVKKSLLKKFPPFVALFVNRAGRSLWKRPTAAEVTYQGDFLVYHVVTYTDYVNDRAHFTSGFSFYLKIIALHNLYSNKLSSSKDYVKKQQFRESN